MLAPILVYLFIFKFYPIGHSFWISFQRWTIVTQGQFVGLANYRRLFAAESLFWVSLRHNVYYLSMILLGATLISLIVAAALNMIISHRARALISSFYYIPYIVPAIAVGLIWRDLYHPTLGLINLLLTRLGLSSQPWLGSSSQAMTAISITGIWQILGFNTVVYLAALQGIPTRFYEAAAIDGSSKWQSFLHITTPCLRPVTLFIMVMNTIWAFQLYALIYTMTLRTGGPADATYTLVFYLWEQGFAFYKMGYAAAIGVAIFFLILCVGVFQFRLWRQEWEY